MFSNKKSLIYNVCELPAYWWHTKRARDKYSALWQVSKFKYGKHRKQYYLEVSSPDQHSRKWAIYLHGGAWNFGTPEQFLPAANLLVEAGYRVIMPSYVRLWQQDFSGIWADLVASLQHYKNQRNLENGPEVIAGMSGGGHLAASLAWRQHVWEELLWERPEKVILCGAVLDLETMPDSFGIRKLAGKKGDEVFQLANPKYWLENNDNPPTHHLLVHGTADKIVAAQQSLCIYEVLKNKPTTVEKMIIPNGTHLDACRWMYREDEVGNRIKKFLL